MVLGEAFSITPEPLLDPTEDGAGDPVHPQETVSSETPTPLGTSPASETPGTPEAASTPEDRAEKQAKLDSLIQIVTQLFGADQYSTSYFRKPGTVLNQLYSQDPDSVSLEEIAQFRTQFTQAADQVCATIADIIGTPSPALTDVTTTIATIRTLLSSEGSKSLQLPAELNSLQSDTFEYSLVLLDCFERYARNREIAKESNQKISTLLDQHFSQVDSPNTYSPEVFTKYRTALIRAHRNLQIIQNELYDYFRIETITRAEGIYSFPNNADIAQVFRRPDSIFYQLGSTIRRAETTLKTLEANAQNPEVRAILDTVTQKTQEIKDEFDTVADDFGAVAERRTHFSAAIENIFAHLDLYYAWDTPENNQKRKTFIAEISSKSLKEVYETLFSQSPALFASAINNYHLTDFADLLIPLWRITHTSEDWVRQKLDMALVRNDLKIPDTQSETFHADLTEFAAKLAHFIECGKIIKTAIEAGQLVSKQQVTDVLILYSNLVDSGRDSGLTKYYGFVADQSYSTFVELIDDLANFLYNYHIKPPANTPTSSKSGFSLGRIFGSKPPSSTKLSEVQLELPTYDAFCHTIEMPPHNRYPDNKFTTVYELEPAT